MMKVGNLVKLHPATDAWMRGFRHGEIVKIGRKYIHVRVWALYMSGKPVERVLRFPLNTDLIEVTYEW